MNCNTGTVGVTPLAETKGFFVTRLEALIETEKTNHGLIGFRLFPVANRDGSVNDIAEEVIAMHENYLGDNYTDISGTEL